MEVSAADGCVTARLKFADAKAKLSPAMGERLLELFEEVEDDQSARMLAVTGTGRAFCLGFEAGVDSRLVESFAVISKPTVAIINGDAIDEGLEFAMAADVRVAIRSARFALTQLGRNSLPRFGGTQRLARLAGVSTALRMLLAGVAVDGVEAARTGLVTYLADDAGKLAEASGKVAQAILSRGPVAVRLAKDAVLKGYDMTLDQGIRLEEDLYALLQTTTDRAEGVRAFLERRKPLFRGA
ncbi:MAG TPA: enoyl-CoA hydratase/isomerase family protein [Candidatus Binataceae bacterium]|nr:enoyl-CoA hydratase/isomerase family protein [Candidatus Binataceae bacterium]